MQFLENVKSRIERLYNIDLNINLEDFLSTLDEPQQQARVDLYPIEDDLYISLYFSEEIYDWLGRIEKDKKIRVRDLPNLSNVIEDTSHFCYLAYKCGMQDIHPENISRYEMELQGYIDTFVLELDYMLNSGTVPKNMTTYFFNHRAINENHPENYKEVYQSAGKLASVYCRFIEEKAYRGEKGKLIEDLRKLYRKDHRGKFEHIKSLSKN